MIKKVLGIDCSSSTIGYSVLEIDEDTKAIKYISCNYLKPSKKGSIVQRIVDTRNKMKKIIDDIKPDYIAIEEIIKFMKGKSSANTIIMLTTFNRMLCLLAYDYLQQEPQLFHVMSIRHGIKLNKKAPIKEEIPDVVSQHLGIKFPYESKLKKNGSYIDENYDKADGVAVALYYSFILTEKIKLKIKKPKRKPKKVDESK